MNLALDSSLAAPAFIFADEATPGTDRILDSLGRGSRAFVPALWRWEIANLLLMAERRQRIAQADTLRHLGHLKSLPIEVDDGSAENAWNTTVELARKHKLTAYDAAYLELAIRKNLGLGSLDRDPRKAAKAEKVALLPNGQKEISTVARKP